MLPLHELWLVRIEMMRQVHSKSTSTFWRPLLTSQSCVLRPFYSKKYKIKHEVKTACRSPALVRSVGDTPRRYPSPPPPATPPLSAAAPGAWTADRARRRGQDPAFGFGSAAARRRGHPEQVRAAPGPSPRPGSRPPNQGAARARAAANRELRERSPEPRARSEPGESESAAALRPRRKAAGAVGLGEDPRAAAGVLRRRLSGRHLGPCGRRRR